MIRQITGKLKLPIDTDKIYIYEKNDFQISRLMILRKEGDDFIYLDNSGIPYRLDYLVYTDYIVNANKRSMDASLSGYKLYECDNEKDIDSFKLSKELLK